MGSACAGGNEQILRAFCRRKRSHSHPLDSKVASPQTLAHRRSAIRFYGALFKNPDSPFRPHGVIFATRNVYRRRPAALADRAQRKIMQPLWTQRHKGCFSSTRCPHTWFPQVMALPAKSPESGCGSQKLKTSSIVTWSVQCCLSSQVRLLIGSYAHWRPDPITSWYLTGAPSPDRPIGVPQILRWWARTPSLSAFLICRHLRAYKCR